MIAHTDVSGNAPLPYSPTNYPTISQAWHAPIPEASDLTTQLIVNAAVLSSVAAPILVATYACEVNEFSKAEITRCFPKPAAFNATLILPGAFVGLALFQVRNFCYRISHSTQTGYYLLVRNLRQ